MKILLGLLLAGAAWAADACYTNVAQGSYGFLLWGTTTASGAAKPIASIGRLTLDGRGGISGTSSVMFADYLLGNPVTGSYEARTDCSITWKLQDDSGNWQHFKGKFSTDGTHITFTQTDATAPHNGTMIKSPDACSADTLQARRYEWAHGTVGGKDLTVEDDCFVSFGLNGDQFRGIVVDGGREVLAIRSNPGAPLTVRLAEAAKQNGQARF